MGKHRRKLKWFFKYTLRKPFVWLHNYFFCLKYPFWRSRNVWTGKFLGYSYTWYDNIPYGWRKAFGKQLSKELKEVLKKELKENKNLKWKDILFWEDIKEKYGDLRLYCSTTKKAHEVVNKYEALSRGYCIECGKPARYCTKGWIEYYCEECFDKYEGKYEDECSGLKEACRLKEEDIPKTVFIGEDGVLKEDILGYKYGIDFYKLWDIEKNK